LYKAKNHIYALKFLFNNNICCDTEHKMNVLGCVCYRNDMFVWDIQAFLGLNTKSPWDDAGPCCIKEVWLPDAIRGVTPSLIKLYWKVARNQRIPAYHECITTYVLELVDKIGECATVCKFLNTEWVTVLNHCISKQFFNDACHAIVALLSQGVQLYPQLEDMFAHFNVVQPQQLKVVFVTPNVPCYKHTLQDSPLQNGIELKSIPHTFSMWDDDLSFIKRALNYSCTNSELMIRWGEQGVLFLPSCAVITTKKNVDTMWAQFIMEAIMCINNHFDGVVFVLWGKLGVDINITVTKHQIISILSPQHHVLSQSNVFAKINSKLKILGHNQIQW